jgi:hypothetical protein
VHFEKAWPIQVATAPANFEIPSRLPCSLLLNAPDEVPASELFLFGEQFTANPTLLSFLT